MSSITPLQALKPSQSEWRSELKSTLSLGWPLILTNLAQTILTATDLALIGRLGADSLAAAALAASFYHAVMIFCLGVVSAVMPLIASTLGARPHAVREVRITIRHGFWIAGLVSLPVWLLLWNADSVLILLGQQPEVARRSLEFMHALQWALLPFLGYIVLRSYLNAMESPIWTLAVGCAAIVFNALAAWCLIFGNLGFPSLGLAGAGLASFCSSLLMFGGLALVASRHRRFRRYHLFGNLFDIDMRRLRQVWQLGLPIGATMAFETTIFYAAVVMMGLIGQTALAAHAIAMQIASIGFMVPLGFGQVATIRVGRAYGARDAAGIARAGWSAYALGVGFMVLTASLMLFAPTLLIGLFIDIRDPQNADVVQLGAGFLALAALFQLADGAQVVGAGMLRGIHDTRVPMLLAALGYWGIGLPLGAALAFGLDMGGAGVWLGLAAGLGTVAVLMTRRWMRRGHHYAIGIP